MDAAILFADILLPIEPMGLDLAFVKGAGPQISNPVRGEADVQGLRSLDAEADLGHVMEAIRLLRAELPPQVPLIGFSGPPSTI